METLVAIFCLGISTSFHEWLHAAVAHSFGMVVEKVFVGVPLWPTWKIVVKETEFVISPWLFTGGTVIKKESYWETPLWQRVFVSVYGPIANLITGLLVAIFAFGGQTGLKVAQEMCSATFGSAVALLRGQVAFTDISGPVEIITIASQAIKTDFWLGTVFVLLLLNFGLAVMNLMPIPALDGGFITLGLICRFVFRNSPKSLERAQLLSEICSFPLVAVIAVLTVLEIGDILTML